MGDVTIGARVNATTSPLTPLLQGEGNVTVNVNVERVGSDVDVELLAWRVAQEIGRRR